MSITTDVATVVNRAPAVAPAPSAQVPDLAAMGLSQREAASMWNVCKVLAATPVFGPPLYGNPGVVMGVALYLRAFDIPLSLVSLKRVHVWEEDVREKQPNGQWVTVGKKVCMQEDYRLLLGLLHRAGHDCWLETLDDEKCTFVFVHRDHPGREQRFTFTLKMAERAGLLDKPNWKKNPHWMMPAAAVRMCARLGAPEATLGFDLGDEDGRAVTPVDYPGIATQSSVAPLPGVAELVGSDPTFAGNKTAEGHVRSLRDDAPFSAAERVPAPERAYPLAQSIHIAASKAGLSADALDDIIRYVTGDAGGSAKSVTPDQAEQVFALIAERAAGGEAS